VASLVSDIIDRILRLTDRVDPSSRGRALDAVDEAIQWYAFNQPWDSLRREEEFVSSGSEYLSFPDRVLQILSIADITNRSPVEAGDNFDKRDPENYLARNVNRACEWRQAGIMPVIAQPNTDTTLTVDPNVSESFDVIVRGLVRDTMASGTALELKEVNEILSINSSEAQTTTAVFAEVNHIMKPRPTTAEITITENADSRIISRIPPWEARPMFPRVQFLNVPAVATRFELTYFRRPDRVTTEVDPIDPSIPEEALIWRAAGNLHWMDQESQQAERAWGQARQLLADRKKAEDIFGEKDHRVDPQHFYFLDEEINDF